MRRFRRKTLLVAGLAGGLLAAAGAWSLSRKVGTPATPPYVTFLVIDGLSQKIFQRELQAGRLPNMAGLLSQGTYVENGISSFPSMTGYGFYPLLTGRDAARSRVLGLRWFDRGRDAGSLRHYVGRTNTHMNSDFRADAKWLFERYPGVHSYTLNSYANRGVVRSELTGWWFSMAKYRDKKTFVRALGSVPGLGSVFPDWKRAEKQAVGLAIADLKNRPKVQWVTFTSTDASQHIAGTNDAYVELLRNIDTLIGDYRAESTRLGQEKDRIYVLLSDHGVADASRNIDLRRTLGELGLRTWRGEATHFGSELSEPLSDFEAEDAIIAINGNMLNHIYLREGSKSGGDAWRTRPSADVVDAYVPRAGRSPVNVAEHLRKAEGVELVITRPGAQGIRVFGKKGTGFITGEEGAVAYRCDGEDPLGTGACDGRPRTAAEWLQQTYSAPFPDSIMRIHRLMSTEEVGELVVTSEPGVDLAADYELVVGNYRGGHGGLRAEQLLVPYALAGPGVPSGRVFPTARAEDIGATVLRLLGEPLPEGAEGVPLPLEGTTLVSPSTEPTSDGPSTSSSGTAAP